MTERQTVEHRWLNMGLIAKLVYSVCTLDPPFALASKLFMRLFYIQTGLRTLLTDVILANFEYLNSYRSR